MENDPQVILKILENTRTIASVGLSTNPDKDSYQVVQYLQQHGYRIIPVNPVASDILGEKAYPDLLSIPETPDVVQIFRRPEDTPAVVEQAIQKGVKAVWFQLETTNSEAAHRAREAGLEVVEEACMRVAHRALMTDRGRAG